MPEALKKQYDDFEKNKVLDLISAVSYTHLDVYKRQAKPTPQPAAPAQTQSAAEPAPSAPAAPAASSASKSIEDVRGMLARCV